MDTLQARMGTGGGNMPLAFHQKQTPVSGEVSPTLGTSSQGMGVHTESIVRRLTPGECEVLQGFPLDFTKFDENDKEMADSHRYKQLGNAVTVNVVDWIVGNLQ